MKVHGKGFGNRYANDGCGNHLDRIRNSVFAGGFNMGRRIGRLPGGDRELFCENCQTAKPRLGTQPHKGWKCKECRQKYWEDK